MTFFMSISVSLLMGRFQRLRGISKLATFTVALSGSVLAALLNNLLAFRTSPRKGLFLLLSSSSVVMGSSGLSAFSRACVA